MKDLLTVPIGYFESLGSLRYLQQMYHTANHIMSLSVVPGGKEK